MSSAARSTPSDDAQPTRALRAALHRHLHTGRVSRVIYGSVIGVAVVVALEVHPPGVGAVLATILGTALAVALAELYSDVVGTQIRKHRGLRHAERRDAAADVAAVAAGIAFPAVFFVLAAAGLLQLHTAFTLAKWTGVGLISFYGFCAGRLAGNGVAASLLQAIAVGLIGSIVIVIKAIVH